MKYVVILLLFFTHASSCQKNTIERMTPDPPNIVPRAATGDTSSTNFTYLALGDSYTIGHGVQPEDNYPNQTISLLKKDNLNGQVKIIATTGWTTDNLKAGIENDTTILPEYDIVSLLIGVNNQYQGAPIESYRPAFEDLLKKSIGLAGNHPSHVIVLSIPDWSVTAFASGRDRNLISKEIDAYNAINKEIAEKYGVNYIDITPWTREAASDPSLIASDGLHPSGKEYARWALRLEGLIKNALK
jgi:lysophospholipase L1-like esterase